MSERSGTQRRRSIYVGGFSHSNPVPAASRIGGVVFSGAVNGRDPDTKEMPRDLDAQCRNMFRHVREIVEASGGSTDDIIKVTVWLREFRDRAALNREWEAMFPDPESRPSRHAIAANFDGNTLVQCEFTAVIADPGMSRA